MLWIGYLRARAGHVHNHSKYSRLEFNFGEYRLVGTCPCIIALLSTGIAIVILVQRLDSFTPRYYQYAIYSRCNSHADRFENNGHSCARLN